MRFLVPPELGSQPFVLLSKLLTLYPRLLVFLLEGDRTLKNPFLGSSEEVIARRDGWSWGGGTILEKRVCSSDASVHDTGSSCTYERPAEPI
jgi:hypothetical protein